jgi:hypothetical protein
MVAGAIVTRDHPAIMRALPHVVRPSLLTLLSIRENLFLLNSMIRYNFLLFATFVLLHSALGQNLDSMTKEQRDVYFAKIRSASEADHKAMMNSLGIESLRPGVNGNDPTAPNGVNYDEAKANPFPKLPEVLVMKNGKVVKDAKSWWSKRVPEIREDFDREVYPRVHPLCGGR